MRTSVYRAVWAALRPRLGRYQDILSIAQLERDLDEFERLEKYPDLQRWHDVGLADLYVQLSLHDVARPAKLDTLLPPAWTDRPPNAAEWEGVCAFLNKER